jgi:hypothetical protein
MALFTLYVQYAGRPPETKPFDKELVVIGRDVGDIALMDPQVSGRHAELRFHAGKLVFNDLGSTNGSFLPNGQRVSGSVELGIGNAVRLGQSTITVQHIDFPGAVQQSKTIFAGAGGAPPPAQHAAPAPIPGLNAPIRAAQPSPPMPGAPPGYPPAPAAPGYPQAAPPPPQAPGYPPSQPAAPMGAPMGGPPPGMPPGMGGPPPGPPPGMGAPPPMGPPGMQPGMGQPGMQPGMGQPGMQPGMGQPGMQPGMGQPGMQPGMGQPGMQPGMGQPGMQPGMGQPGMGQPGMQPGMGQPGMGQPGMSPGQQFNQGMGQVAYGMNQVAAAADASGQGFVDDIKHALGLFKENMIPAIMIFGVPLVGGAVVSAPFVILNIMVGIGSLLGSLLGLLGIVAGPAVYYFMAQAHMGNKIGWLDAYKAVLGRGIPSIVNFLVSAFIGAIALFFPLGFFVGPIWLFEDKKFFEQNMRSLELWKPVIVRTILATLILGAIVNIVLRIPSTILLGIFDASGFMWRLFFAIFAILNALGTAILVPLVAAISIKVYFEVREQMEGVDPRPAAKQQLEQIASGAAAIPGVPDSFGQIGQPQAQQGMSPQGYPQGMPQQGMQPQGYPQGGPPQQPPQGYPQGGPQGGPPQQPPQGYPGGPPQQQGYPGGPPPPQQQGYPPQQQGYPQGGPPQPQGYPPQPQGYPPQQQGYPPQQQGYPPQQGGPPPGGGYPPYGQQ